MLSRKHIYIYVEYQCSSITLWEWCLRGSKHLISPINLLCLQFFGQAHKTFGEKIKINTMAADSWHHQEPGHQELCYWLWSFWFTGILCCKTTYIRERERDFMKYSHHDHHFACGLVPNNNKLLSINMQRANYLSLNWSISWLLMPWLLASPGHQPPWYWLSLIGKLLPWSRKDLSYLCHINVDEGHKIWIYVMFPLNNLSHKRVKTKLSIYLLHNLPWHSFNSLQHWFC